MAGSSLKGKTKLRVISEEVLGRVFSELESMMASFPEAVVDAMVKDHRDPFKVLIATLISLRTKDEVTGKATERLFQIASTPFQMVLLEPEVIEKAIFPAGFYRNKAKTIIHVCSVLISKYEGNVPSTIDELIAIKGVGRKTANLVLSSGFGIDAICVDTHVHRICNRWGYVNTSTPDATEMLLRRKLPQRYWIRINALLVVMGQNICKPVSPLCSSCSLKGWFCPSYGVKKSR
jgi:endonuclease-3